MVPHTSHWIRATAVGWLLGLLLVIALAFAFDAIGLSGTQSFVGIGMSLGVAWMQRRHVPVEPRKWLRVTVGGVSAPFLLADITSLIGLGVGFSLPVCTALGGGLAGWWQARALGALVVPGRWTLLSLGGWTIGAGAALGASELMAMRYIVGVPALLAFIALTGIGGVLLGLISSRGFKPQRGTT